MHSYLITGVYIKGHSNLQGLLQIFNSWQTFLYWQFGISSSPFPFSSSSIHSVKQLLLQRDIQNLRELITRWILITHEMVGPRRPQFVLFGSSIVQFSFSNGGWGSILADIYARKADIVLRGYFGWNSRRAVPILDQVFPKDADIQPSLVIVYFGGNDSMGPHTSGQGPHVPLPEYKENMRKIAIHLKSLSDSTRLLFLSCPPVNEAKVRENASSIFSELVRTNDLCRSYSEACIELCKEMGIKVVDLWTAIQKQKDWQTACFTDGVHLSEGGSKIVVEEILKVLKVAEWTPSLHWKSMPTEFAEDSPYDLVASDGKTTLNASEWTFHRAIKWD